MALFSHVIYKVLIITIYCFWNTLHARNIFIHSNPLDNLTILSAIARKQPWEFMMISISQISSDILSTMLCSKILTEDQTYWTEDTRHYQVKILGNLPFYFNPSTITFNFPRPLSYANTNQPFKKEDRKTNNSYHT